MRANCLVIVLSRNIDKHKNLNVLDVINLFVWHLRSLTTTEKLFTQSLKENNELLISNNSKNQGM